MRGYDPFDFFLGEFTCPPKFVIHTETGVTKEIVAAYKEWVKKDMVLLVCLLPLSVDSMEHVIKCKTSHEAWTCLQERFASISVVRVNQLKTELHPLAMEATTTLVMGRVLRMGPLLGFFFWQQLWKWWFFL